jgi:hypothetical protein
MQVKERMQTSMLEMIAKERSSELVDRGLLKTVAPPTAAALLHMPCDASLT